MGKRISWTRRWSLCVFFSMAVVRPAFANETQFNLIESLPEDILRLIFRQTECLPGLRGVCKKFKGIVDSDIEYHRQRLLHQISKIHSYSEKIIETSYSRFPRRESKTIVLLIQNFYDSVRYLEELAIRSHSILYTKTETEFSGFYDFLLENLNYDLIQSAFFKVVDLLASRPMYVAQKVEAIIEAAQMLKFLKGSLFFANSSYQWEPSSGPKKVFFRKAFPHVRVNNFSKEVHFFETFVLYFYSEIINPKSVIRNAPEGFPYPAGKQTKNISKTISDFVSALHPKLIHPFPGELQSDPYFPYFQRLIQINSANKYISLKSILTDLKKSGLKNIFEEYAYDKTGMNQVEAVIDNILTESNDDIWVQVFSLIRSLTDGYREQIYENDLLALLTNSISLQEAIGENAEGFRSDLNRIMQFQMAISLPGKFKEAQEQFQILEQIISSLENVKLRVFYLNLLINPITKSTPLVFERIYGLIPKIDHLLVDVLKEKYLQVLSAKPAKKQKRSNE